MNDREKMADVQNMPDGREIEIDKVGVKNVKYPIIVLDRTNGHQNTIATIDMYVNLPHYYKGTHMSRFVEILHEYKDMINMKNFPDILREMKARLDAEAAQNRQFDKKLAAEEVWIRSGIKARRTRNEGRVRALQKMRDEYRRRRSVLGKARMQVHAAPLSGAVAAVS